MLNPLKRAWRDFKQNIHDTFAGLYFFFFFGSTGIVFFCLLTLLTVFLAYACYGVYAVTFLAGLGLDHLHHPSLYAQLVTVNEVP
jgi:apolipoprotein N-acyltransferase